MPTELPTGPVKQGLNRTSKIAALIPHYKCEQWLSQCLESLIYQTRKPDAIIVIDDASKGPPELIVRRYPGVTLLRSPQNVGPYRLIQQVIELTAFDGYMFQDADDWSGPRRLELLLAEAEESGAELIGCQEMRLFTGTADAQPFYYEPLVRERALRFPRGYPLLHPSSIVSRSLVTRLGGFATGLRFGGDSEFLRRAIWDAHVTNIPYLSYFRRMRPGSLTMAPETGSKSQGRIQHRQGLADLTRARLESHARQERVDLSPLSTASAIELVHVCGPALRDPQSAAFQNERSAQPESRATASDGASLQLPPLIIVGERAASVALVHAALSQHPALLPLTIAPWIAGVQRKHVVQNFPRPRVIPDFNWVDGSAAYINMVPELAEAFPSVRFVVVRTPEDAIRDFGVDPKRLHVLSLTGSGVLSQEDQESFFNFMGLVISDASSAKTLSLLESGFV